MRDSPSSPTTPAGSPALSEGLLERVGLSGWGPAVRPLHVARARALVESDRWFDQTVAEAIASRMLADCVL